MSLDPPAAAGLARAYAHLIARRVWIFAVGWVLTLLVWLAVFVVSGRATLIAGATFLAGNVVLLAGLRAYARRRPVPTWIRAGACGVCVALGVALGFFAVAVQVPGDVLAFILLTLYLMSALLFAWGWRLESALLVGTMAPLAIMTSALEFFVAPLELVTALAAGTVLCLAVAEGASRSFRVAFLQRASAAEAAEAVLASRDAYRDLAENAGDYIYATDLAGRVTYVNEAAAGAFGRSASEFVGTSVFEFVTDHPENPSFQSVLDSLSADGTLPLLRIQFLTAQGPRWFEARMSPVRDATGNMKGLRGISRDIDARVHAERRLRESEERYRSLVESQHEAIIRFDVAGRTTFCNEYWLHTIGSTAAEVAARKQLRLVHPDDRATLVKRLKGLRAGQPRETRRHRVLTVYGYRWFEWESSSIVDAGGGVVEFQAVGRDVHEHHLAEEAVRESEARYRVLVESQQTLLSRSDAAGVLTFVNDRLCAALGRTREELLGESLLDYIHPDDAPSTLGMIEAFSTAPYRAPVREVRIRTGSGFRWFEWEGFGLLDDSGALVEIQTLGRDVTERREARESLRASEARYRGLVESQHDLVFRGDTDGRTVFVNEALCRKFGIRREDLLAGSFRLFVCPQDIELTSAAIRALQQPPYRRTVLNRCADAEGAVRWIEWEAAGVADAAGHVVEVQGVGRDVTERRQADETLQRSLEDLRRSREQLRALAQRQVAIREQERKRLGLDLHDDVCQELVGIGILVESLRRRLGPISTENARVFDRVGGYLGQLVDHLRLLARELQPLQLQDLGLEGSMRSLVRGFSSADCSVESIFSTSIPRLREEAEVGVYRIAQEALTNAVRHAEARNVRLMLAIVGNNLRLEVSDDGRGFDPKTRTDAFGLISMEERALALGGRFAIWSAAGGGGTTVRLECPLGDAASAA